MWLFCPDAVCQAIEHEGFPAICLAHLGKKTYESHVSFLWSWLSSLPEASSHMFSFIHYWLTVSLITLKILWILQKKLWEGWGLGLLSSGTSDISCQAFVPADFRQLIPTEISSGPLRITTAFLYTCGIAALSSRCPPSNHMDRSPILTAICDCSHHIFPPHNLARKSFLKQVTWQLLLELREGFEWSWRCYFMNALMSKAVINSIPSGNIPKGK